MINDDYIVSIVFIHEYGFNDICIYIYESIYMTVNIFTTGKTCG